MISLTFTGTLEQLRDLFDYDPDTGTLTWRTRDTRYAKNQAYADRWNTRFAGQRAETDDYKGYYQTAVCGKLYRTHRICYALAYSIDLADVPPEVDHEDGDGQHNAKTNLRASSRSTNAKNGRIRTRNTSGLKGVSWDKSSSSWRAHIMVNRRQYDKRGFASAELAHVWYLAKARELHEEFGCGNANGILA